MHRGGVVAKSMVDEVLVVGCRRRLLFALFKLEGVCGDDVHEEGLTTLWFACGVLFCWVRVGRVDKCFQQELSVIRTLKDVFTEFET